MQLHLKTNSKFANSCSTDNSARWSCICREKGRNGGSASLLRDTWYILSVIARYCQVLQERHLVYLVRPEYQFHSRLGGKCSIQTNTLCNLDKYTYGSISLQAGEFFDLNPNKYISQVGQIHFAIFSDTHTDQFHSRLREKG